MNSRIGMERSSGEDSDFGQSMLWGKHCSCKKYYWLSADCFILHNANTLFICYYHISYIPYFFQPKFH